MDRIAQQMELKVRSLRLKIGSCDRALRSPFCSGKLMTRYFGSQLQFLCALVHYLWCSRQVFLQLINTLYCIRKFCLVLPVIRTLKTKLSITDIDKANAKATTNWWNYSWNLLQPVSCCVSCMKRPAAVASTGPGPDTQEAALSPN